MIGKALGHYQIVEQIGAGGMGEVYRARDTRLERDVALKILPAALAQDPERRARFEREAKAIARFKHPNIVTIHSVEEADGVHFLTMELVEGGTLGGALKSGRLPLDRLFAIAVPLVDAVCAAHAQGITHRDLKPANVMLDAAQRVKVLDFGLAKLMEAPVGLDDATMSLAQDITDDGRIVGTVSYMSPEQAEGKPVDPRSDVFSLGVLLYEMAAGQRPFAGETRISTMSAILKDTPTNVAELNQELPRHLGRIIHRCLAKEPERRYQSAIDLRNELEELRDEVSGDHGVASRPAEPAAGAAGSPLRMARILVPLFLVVAAIWWFTQRDRGPEQGGVAETSLDFNAVAVLYFENLSDPTDTNRLGRIAASLLTPALTTSSDLTMISEQRLFDVLRRLKKEDAVLDRTVASEVARAAGAGRVILGQVSLLGEQLTLTSQVIDMQSGAVLSSHRAEGKGQESLFRLVDQLAQTIVGELHAAPEGGETAPSTTSLTTASLDAYRSYQEGLAYFRHHRFDEAYDAFDAAVEEDPDFAMAHFYRARPFWPFPADDEVAALARARHFADRVTPQEAALIEAAAIWNLDRDAHGAVAALLDAERRFPEEHRLPFLRGRIHHFSTGNGPAAVEALLRARRVNPDDTFTMNSLAYAYTDVRDFEAATATLEEYIALEPTNPNAYDSLGEIHVMSGNYDAAIEAFTKAHEVRPGFFSIVHVGYIQAMRGQYEEAIAAFQQAAEQSDLWSQSISHLFMGLTYHVTGRLALAIDAWANGVDKAILFGDPSLAQLMCMTAAVLTARAGEPEARDCERVGGGDIWTPLVRAMYGAQLALAEGDPVALESALETMVPPDIAVGVEGSLQRAGLRLRVAMLAKQGRTQEAVDLQSPALPMREEEWVPSNYFTTTAMHLPLERDGLAQALGHDGRVEEAIAEYRRLLNPDRRNQEYQLVPQVYHYRLAVLLERAGQPEGAATHYQTFLEAWAIADSNQPELEDARRRLASLAP